MQEGAHSVMLQILAHGDIDEKSVETAGQLVAQLDAFGTYAGMQELMLPAGQSAAEVTAAMRHVAGGWADGLSAGRIIQCCRIEQIG